MICIDHVRFKNLSIRVLAICNTRSLYFEIGDTSILAYLEVYRQQITNWPFLTYSPFESSLINEAIRYYITRYRNRLEHMADLWV